MKKELFLYVAWLQALAATLLSLFFSEIIHFPPCTLCWYQRTMMYPLAIILTIGILRKDKNIGFYVLPLSIIGLFVAIYHNLVYYNIIAEPLAPCVVGIPCNTRQLELFGFITIPMLSLIAFAIITFCIITFLKKR